MRTDQEFYQDAELLLNFMKGEYNECADYEANTYADRGLSAYEKFKRIQTSYGIARVNVERINIHINENDDNHNQSDLAMAVRSAIVALTAVLDAKIKFLGLMMKEQMISREKLDLFKADYRDKEDALLAKCELLAMIYERVYDTPSVENMESAAGIVYDVFVSTCRTVAKVQLCKSKGKDVYTKYVSKIESIPASCLKEAFEKFEDSDSYILFSARNKGNMLFKFFITPDHEMHRLFEDPNEVVQVYEQYTTEDLENLYRYYQTCAKSQTSPNSLFSDYILLENQFNFGSIDVAKIEKYLIASSSQPVQQEYNKLIKEDCSAPKTQYHIAELLLKASNEEHQKSNPNSPICQWVMESFRSPALLWISKAVDNEYLPAFSFESMLLSASAKDFNANTPLSLALLVHAALLGDTAAQVRLAAEHAEKMEDFNIGRFAKHSPELAEFWYKLLIEKDDPNTYESIAFTYYIRLHNDYSSSNKYYKKLVSLGYNKYYADLIPGLVYANNVEACYEHLNNILEITDVSTLKKIFDSFEFSKIFEKLAKRDFKYELAQKIVQLDGDVLYQAYLAEAYYQKGDISAFRKCVHLILGSSSEKAISKAYNLFKKDIFTKLEDINLEMEFLACAQKLGNPRAAGVLHKGYKKGLFGGWKHTKEWNIFSL